MSHSEDELWDLLNQATSMPYGAAQIALVEQVIAHADAQHLTPLAFAARMQGTSSYVYGGEPARSVVTFSWCLAEFDRDPTAYAPHARTLLWHFKYMVSSLTRFPEVTLDRTYAVLDDMESRWLGTGHSLHAVYAHRHFVARHVGDLENAERYYAKWCTTPRDDLSDCIGCDPSSKAWWLSSRGRDEEAVALAEPVLAGTLTCSEQPQGILTNVLFPYLRTGRLDQARDAHRRAYRLHRSNLADLADIAEHVEFCARTGNEARGVEIMERHLGWLDRAPSPYAAMTFAAAGALLLSRAGDVTLHRPAHGDRAAAHRSGADLGTELAALATGIAARFDVRNGTERVSRSVQATLAAQPFVEYLPLSAAAARRLGSTVDFSPAGPTMTGPPPMVAPPVPPPVMVVPPSTVDELLTRLDELRVVEREREYEATLAAAFERFPLADLTALQRARLTEARAAQLAFDRKDVPGAIALLREAERDFAEAGDELRRQKTVARLGVLLCVNGDVGAGEPMMVGATEYLLANESPKVRCDAALRLATGWMELYRFADVLSTLDRVAADLPLVDRATHADIAVQRMVATAELGDPEAARAMGPATLALAAESGVPRVIIAANLMVGRCLEHLGESAEAVGHLDAALAVSDSPAVRQALRATRGSLLVRADRPADAVEDLTESVAALTAEGDAAGAAESRYWLAVAYRDLDRLLDAAEVAEESLAYVLGQSSTVDTSAVAGEVAPPDQSMIRGRYLLSGIYQQLGEQDNAVAQLDAIGEECARTGNRAGVGQMAREAADILDRLDRDDAAAARYLNAAEAYHDADRPLEELHNRRRHAMLLHWAHGAARSVAALTVAERFAAGLPAEIGPRLVWERAMLGYDAARILLGAQRLDDAATRAEESVRGFRQLELYGEASDAGRLQAQVLLESGQSAAAEVAIRLALADLPRGARPDRNVELLAAILEAQNRPADAAACWAEYGLTPPD